MFEKLQTGEKIHDAPRQPRTCSHPIYTRTLTGVWQAIKIFSPCFFHAFISINLLFFTTHSYEISSIAKLTRCSEGSPVSILYWWPKTFEKETTDDYNLEHWVIYYKNFMDIKSIAYKDYWIKSSTQSIALIVTKFWKINHLHLGTFHSKKQQLI